MLDDPRQRKAELLKLIRESKTDKDALKVIDEYESWWVHNCIRHARWAYEAGIEALSKLIKPIA